MDMNVKAGKMLGWWLRGLNRPNSFSTIARTRRSSHRVCSRQASAPRSQQIKPV
jgi:hypothetical protein